MVIPAWRNDHWTRPEQSKVVGPLPPHTYGSPRRLIAAASMTLIADEAAPPSVDGPAPAAPELELDPPWVTTLTSCSTLAPDGSRFPTALAAALMPRPRMLI